MLNHTRRSSAKPQNSDPEKLHRTNDLVSLKKKKKQGKKDGVKNLRDISISFKVRTLFIFLLVMPIACRSFQARDSTHTIAATLAAALTTPDP